MAERRRLVAEMDKCFKKIDEGVEEFETIMAKMQDANSENQREKYQDDLKKEIKKLQRLRDQVKGWQNSSDIKDKDKLVTYRRLIEQRMEQFKDIERENKTKPHSKQGLCAEEKMDPHEKEKCDAVEWIQNQIRGLTDESDRTEMQLESITNQEGQGKKRGKKDDGKKSEKEKRMEELKKHLERMKFHIGKLEICMRMVNNESLEPRRVIDVLREPMEMYIEVIETAAKGDDGDAPDNYDPEDAYEELNLAALCAQIGAVNIGSVDEDHKENGHDNGLSSTPSLDEDLKAAVSRHTSSDAAPVSPAARRTIAVNAPGGGHPHTLQHKLSKEDSSDSSAGGGGAGNSGGPAHSSLASVSSTGTPPPVASGPPGIPYNSVAAGRTAASIVAGSQTSQGTPPASATQVQKQETQQVLTNQGQAQQSIAQVVKGANKSTTSQPLTTGLQNDENRVPSVTTVTSAAASTTSSIGTSNSAEVNESASKKEATPQKSEQPNILIGEKNQTSSAQPQATTVQPTIAESSRQTKEAEEKMNNGGRVFEQPSANVMMEQQYHQHQLQSQQQQLMHEQYMAAQQAQAQEAGVGQCELVIQTHHQEYVPRSASNQQQMLSPLARSQMLAHAQQMQQQQQQQQLQFAYSPSMSYTGNGQQAPHMQQQGMAQGIVANMQNMHIMQQPEMANNNYHAQRYAQQGDELSISMVAELAQQQQQQAGQQQKEMVAGQSTGQTAQGELSNGQGGNGTAGLINAEDQGMRVLRSMAQSNTQPVNNKPQRANIPAWLGASPLGRMPTTPEFETQLNSLEMALMRTPLPMDSERPRTYLPKIPCPCSPYYPQTPPANSDTLEYYLRLSPETLFFIFYYMEGTRAQLLAAKALKKLSWRFHTKYLTWFQRHEEPKHITDDYEQGTYVYFDFEKWSQRKKEAFTFEYRYLEDKDFD